MAQPRMGLLTADEFDELPEPESGAKQELDEGEVVRELMVTFEHGELQAEIATRLRDFVRRHELGRVTVESRYRLGDAIVRGPDVSFVRTGNLPPVEERRRGSMPVPPDLAVEVTSPTDRDGSIQRKVQQYLAAGCARVWVVRPEDRSVTIHRPDGSSQRFSDGDILSSADAGFDVDGFAIDIRELFDAVA